MENEIKQIIQNAQNLRNKGYSDKQLAEFVHIELGKLIIYNNNYSIGFEYDLSQNFNGQKSKTSEIRQSKILSRKSSILSREQVCKGMAEIYTAILTKLGIDAKVVAVQSKEEVEGEKREDGSIIDVPGIYTASFDSDYEIQIGENEKSNHNPIGHYYTIVKLNEGEFIQDFLTEKSLTRIKIGEVQLGNDLPGFHRKEEHRERTNSQVSKICPKYVDKIQEEMRKYMQGKDDSKVFDFVFEKLKEYIDEFGFEEAKDFVMMYAQSIIPRGMIKEAPIPINLVKEDEDNCEVLCVYKYGDNNYLLRGGQSSIDLPIGKISVEEIETINLGGFAPRKLNDAKYMEEMRGIKKLDISECELDNIESCYHLTRGVHEYSIEKMGLGADIGIRSKDGVGNENTSKVFFAKSLEGTLIFLNRNFNIFYSAAKYNNFAKYRGAVSDDRPDLYEQIFEEMVHDNMSESELTEVALALGKLYLERGVYYKLDLKHCTKEDFQNMDAQEQDEIDYFSDDINEENNEPMTINNMHTRTGRGVKTKQMTLMTTGGKKSALDIAISMSEAYKTMNPGRSLPVLEHKDGSKDRPLLEMLVEIMRGNDKQSAEQRKNTFLASRKINTPICIEAGKQTAKDQRTMEQQNEGHNNYGE